MINKQHHQITMRGIMVDGSSILEPSKVKVAFPYFFKRKIVAYYRHSCARKKCQFHVIANSK